MKRRRIRIGSNGTREGTKGRRANVGTGLSVGRWIRAVVGGILVMGVFMYLGAAIVLQAVLDAEDVGRWVAPRASAALNRPVSVEGASLSLFPLPGFNTHGLTVGNLPGFQGPPLAQVGRVRLQVALLPLLTGTVRVTRIDIHEPILHLAVDAEGRSNYGDLVPESRDAPEGSPEAPFSVEIREVRMSGGQVTVLHQPQGERLTVFGLSGTTELRPAGQEGGWRLTTTADTDSLLIRRPALGERDVRTVGPSVRMEAVSDSLFHRVHVARGQVSFADAAVAFTGQVDSLRNTSRWVDAHLVADSLATWDVLAVFPESLRGWLPSDAQGHLSLDLTVRGNLDPEQRPAAEGTVALDRVGLSEGGVSLVQNLTGEMEILEDRAEIASFAGAFLGGSFTVEGEARNGDPHMTLQVDAHPVLGNLQALGMLPPDVGLSGNADIDVAISRSAAVEDGLHVDGRITAVGVRAEHPELHESIYVPRAELSLRETQASWADVTLLLGEDPISTSGTVRALASLLNPSDEKLPEMEVEVHAPRLRLDRILRPGGGSSRPTYSQIAFAHVGGRRLIGQAPAELARARGLSRPGSLPVIGAMELQLDTLEYGVYHLEQVSGRVELARESLTVDDLEMGVWGGTVWIGLTLGLGPDAEEPFRLVLEAEGVEGPAFASALTPLGQTVQGTLYLDLDVSGTTDSLLLPSTGSLEGSGRLLVRNGGLDTNPLTATVADFLEQDAWEGPEFTAWVAPFEIRDGAFHLRDSALESDLGQMRATGSIDLAGRVDLGLSLSIPADELASISLRRTGMSSAVVSRLREAGSPLQLGLRLGGSVLQPTLEPDGRFASTAMSTPAARGIREAPRASRADSVPRPRRSNAPGGPPGM
jgi:hypothetical protein